MLWLPGISTPLNAIIGHCWSLCCIDAFLCLQCHVSCVPVFNSMSRKEIKPWGLVVTLSMIICLFVYTGTGIICMSSHVDAFRKQHCNSCCDLSGVACWTETEIICHWLLLVTVETWAFVCVSGVCGYLTFGSNVSQDVLMSYPSNDIAVAFARAFIVICVVTSYPILHFCGR